MVGTSVARSRSGTDPRQMEQTRELVEVSILNYNTLRPHASSRLLIIDSRN